MFVIYDRFRYFMTYILPKATNYEIDLKDHRNSCDWKKCETMGRETKELQDTYMYILCEITTIQSESGLSDM